MTTTQKRTGDCAVPAGAPVLSDDEARDAARAFAALSDPARVKIVRRLLDAPAGSVCVCDVVDLVGLSQPAVSYHLKVLREAGLVLRERHGSFAHYRLPLVAVEWVSQALRVPATTLDATPTR